MYAQEKKEEYSHNKYLKIEINDARKVIIDKYCIDIITAKKCINS